jgi:hypothetical protein
MKKNILISAVAVLLIIGGCSKTATDYTTAFVGTYTGNANTGITFNTVVISKVDDATVSMAFQRDSGQGQFTYLTVQKATVSTANNQNTVTAIENDPLYFSLTTDTVFAVNLNGTVSGKTLSLNGTATSSIHSNEVATVSFVGTKP